MDSFSSFWQVIRILPCYIHSNYIFYRLWRWHFYFSFARSRIQNWRKNGTNWQKILKKINSMEFMEFVLSKSGTHTPPPFRSIYSRDCKKLLIPNHRIWEAPLCVMCHMSGVRCQVSRFGCHFFSFFFWQNGEACLGRVCYQWGLTRLVLYKGFPKSD